jgi:hypothetical protein
MGRSTRSFALLAKLEVTYNVDPIPTGGANAMLVKNLQVNPLNAQNVDRALLRPFFGGSEQLVGTAFKEVSFDIELIGASAAGVAPAWGPLLRACGMAETLIAVTRVDYTPVTVSLESVRIYCNYAGVQHNIGGARGDCTVSLKIGEIPMLRFRFQGIDNSESEVALPSVTLSAFQTPQVVTAAFTPNFKLGGTVSPTGAPAISAGTAFPSTGLEISFGNSLNFKNLIGLQEMEIVDREMAGHIDIDQTAAQEVAQMVKVRGNTLESIAIEHGSAATKKSLVYLPFAQKLNPTYVDLNKSLLQGYDIRAVPSAGNDEFRLVTSY